MTASDTVLPGSALPDPDAESDPQVRDQGWPDPGAPPARNGHRAESYRQLWQPPGRRPVHRQALGQPYVWSGTAEPAPPPPATGGDSRVRADAGRSSPAGRAAILPAGPVRPDARAELEYHRPGYGDPLIGPAAVTERAVIGDLLRIPIAWCQSGTCIAWYADPAALGETDVRARAVAAGWCVDAFGHLVCPPCQQRYHVWSARPLVPRTGRRPVPGTPARGGPGVAGRHRITG